MTAVCGDSHTSTHGAFGSLAFEWNFRGRTCTSNTNLKTKKTKNYES